MMHKLSIPIAKLLLIKEKLPEELAMQLEAYKVAGEIVNADLSILVSVSEETYNILLSSEFHD